MGDHLAGIGLLVRGRHELYVSSLAALLESHGAAIRVSAPEAELPRRLPAGVQIVLLESPLPSDLRAAAALGAPIVVLAERAHPEDRLAAAQLGAQALLAKNATLAELMVSIRHALENREGEPGILPGTRYDLTPRQREVLSLIVEGLDNREIADRLGISERTARAHVSAVLHRLGAANRTQAAVAAVQKGMLGLLALLVALASLGALAERSSAAGATGIASRVSVLGRGVGGASGVWAYDTTTGRRLAAWHSGAPRTPASVEKLLTSSTALDRAGPEARFQTTVVTTGTIADGILTGDLYLRGHGDPSLDYADLGGLARAIRDPGVSEINGQRVRGRELLRRPPRRARERIRDLGLGRARSPPSPSTRASRGRTAAASRRIRRGSSRARFAAKLEAVGRDVAGSAERASRRRTALPIATVWSPPLAALVRHMNTSRTTTTPRS